jgi:hypothetical protein
MHNLHLVVVRAENGEDACSEAESFLMDWGNENNWRTMCGAVSEDNEVYKASEGRYEPDENTNTIAKINKMIKGWLKPDLYSETAKKLLAKGKKVESFNTQELYSLEKYTKFLYEIKSVKQSKAYRRKNGEKVSNLFSVLEDNLYAFSYDECGVTHTDTDGDGKLWVVFVDMHS